MNPPLPDSPLPLPPLSEPALDPLPPWPLPAGVRSRQLPGLNGLDVHLLEAGHAVPGAPALLLLHGFPELSFSWRAVMPALAAAGYHVIAPDLRGYGRTTGWSPLYESDLAPFRTINLVRDALGLVRALGHTQVAAVVGHDFGAPLAAWCALLRPDVFHRVVMMSAPFAGPPALPATGAPAVPDSGAPAVPALTDLPAALAALPRPRKHYQWHFATPEAHADLLHAPQGVHDLLRAYYHVKSADWPGNRPQPLRAATADELARLPTYYVMDLHLGMAATVAAQMPSAAQVAACGWLPDAALRVYSQAFARTGFQGGLNWYRSLLDHAQQAELQVFAGRRIEVPALYLAGRADWGSHQRPGALQAMQSTACAHLCGLHFIDGAGHWVQQEQPAAVVHRLLDFLRDS